MSDAVRRLWRLIEPYHASYLAPEGKELYEAAGLRGGWMRYFAARSSPLGAASVDVVVATFYGFHRRLVERALPDAWTRCTPEDAVTVRLAVADAAIRVSQPHVLEAPDLSRAAALLRQAAEACEPPGRPLFAAHASLPWPTEDHLVLWWACTLLREHRGDGHVALLLAADVGPCESLVWHAATGELDAGFLQSIRGWDDEEWSRAVSNLADRGWLNGNGALTDSGRDRREELEAATDRLARQPWRVVGEQQLTDAVAVLETVLGR